MSAEFVERLAEVVVETTGRHDWAMAREVVRRVLGAAREPDARMVVAGALAVTASGDVVRGWDAMLAEAIRK